ncbi:MAG: hypothetical protein WC575_04860 [Patescibacteria group bacterium]
MDVSEPGLIFTNWFYPVVRWDKVKKGKHTMYQDETPQPDETMTPPTEETPAA